MVLTKNYKKYFVTAGIVWGVCLFIFALAYVFVLIPQSDQQKRVENFIAEKKQTYKSTLKASQTEEKAKQYEKIEELKDYVSNFAIEFENSANLTFDISQIASDKNVSMLNIKGNDRNGISEIPNCKYILEGRLDINFNAEFNQFATLLNDLERHRPVLFIDTFSINRSGQEDVGYQVKLDVAVFVIKSNDEKNSGKS